MGPLELLDQLDRLNVAAAHTRRDGATELSLSIPPDVDVVDLRPWIVEHRGMILATLAGRDTGHAMAACTVCGELTLVAAFEPRSRIHEDLIRAGRRKPSPAVPRELWPACRMTPLCSGRHVPRREDTDRVLRQPPPTQSMPPAHVPKIRLLGQRPSWPPTPIHRNEGTPHA